MKEITYEMLAKANSECQLTPIERKDKGVSTVKHYAEVPEKVKAFRKVYPTGTITTEMKMPSPGFVIFKATVSCDGIILGEGTAYEVEGSNFINDTSFIENAETSAVGRALSFAGFGMSSDSISSAEEVQNAQLQQENRKKDKLTKAQTEKNMKKIREYQDKLPKYSDEFLMKFFKVRSIEEIAGSSKASKKCFDCFEDELKKIKPKEEASPSKVAAETNPEPVATMPVEASSDPLDRYA